MIMTQNEKELLVKDITARLPYGVKASVYSYWNEEYVDDDIVGIDIEEDDFLCSTIPGVRCEIPLVKPYLFPFSSMTEKQKDEIRNRFCYEWESDEDVSDLWKHELEFGYALEFIQWCYENHLDIGGLIPKGLAIDATNKNIY